MCCNHGNDASQASLSAAALLVGSLDQDAVTRAVGREARPTGSEPACTLKMLWPAVLALLRRRLAPDLAAATSTGSNHEINQDSLLQPPSGSALLAVADGVSQSNGGDKASRIAVLALALSCPTDRKALEKAAFAADAAVKESFALFGAGRPAQTTLVAATVRRGAIADYLSIGDSRVYLLRPRGVLSRSYTCEQLTVDQTHGERKKRVAYRHPEKYRDDMMFHAIGAGLVADEVRAERRSIPPGGLLVLATDGFFRGMGADHRGQIALLAASHSGANAAQLARLLVAEAAQRFDTGDDITVAVIIPCYWLGVRWPFWAALGLMLPIIYVTGICF